MSQLKEYRDEYDPEQEFKKCLKSNIDCLEDKLEEFKSNFIYSLIFQLSKKEE